MINDRVARLRQQSLEAIPVLIQFNVVDAATLRAAQRNPQQYRDLIVRVAGYSDYFCDLGPALQDEIIARTEHQTL